MKRHPISVCLVLLAGIAARAELVLEVPDIVLKPEPQDEYVQAPFAFHNKGARPVKVLSLGTSCGRCMKASLDKEVYQPGEKGTGTVEFDLSKEASPFTRELYVRTDDPDQPQWEIPIRVEVPELVMADARALSWSVGDPAVAKVMRVTMTGAEPVKITKIFSDGGQVALSFKERSPGRTYDVTVKPKSTAKAMIEALTIETDCVIGKYQRQTIFVSVYGKAQKPQL